MGSNYVYDPPYVWHEKHVDTKRAKDTVAANRQFEAELHVKREEFLKDRKNWIPFGTWTKRMTEYGSAKLRDSRWVELTQTKDLARWIDETAEEDHSLTVDQLSQDTDYAHLPSSFWKNRLQKVYARKHQRNSKYATLRVYVLPDDAGRHFPEKTTSWKESLLYVRDDPLDLTSCDLSVESWNGTSEIGKVGRHHQLATSDGDSLFYLFNKISSPTKLPPAVSCPLSNEAILSVMDSGQLLGLKTELYQYQKRTVATMIRREAEPTRSMDPRFHLLTGPTNQNLFYDPMTSVLLSDKSLYEEARGGILGESMGLGKTLICLAVIMATRGNWPDVPPEYSLGIHPVETVRATVGSLMDMATTAIKGSNTPWKRIFQDLYCEGEDHQNCVRSLEKDPAFYVIPPRESKYSQRRTTLQKGREIYLSSATLVIVPQNLLSQWKSEISKHIEDDRLKLLSLDLFNERPVPAVKELLHYDVILMSRARFEKEMVPSETVKASSKAKGVMGGCTCSPDEDCHCSRNKEYHTPLRDLHFLRIIMDEGHEFSSSGRSGKLCWALKDLHVDRKWIVTGTPSSGLMGVDVEIAAYQTPGNDGIRHSNQDALENRRKVSAQSQERKDLENLGILVTEFLRVKPWANGKTGDSASWQKYILADKDGRRKAGSLKKLLESLVVRHQIEDIASEIELPPLHNRVVYLQPSWYDKLGINILILSLTVNAVTSERTDQDYMFHPSHRNDLGTLILNLRHAGFYWNGLPAEELVKTLDFSRAYLDKNTDQGSSCSDTDRTLLEKAIQVGTQALGSLSWKALEESHEMGVFVEGFPEQARQEWSLPGVHQSDLLLTGITQLLEAQRYVDSHPYAYDPVAGLIGFAKSTKTDKPSDQRRKRKGRALEVSTDKVSDLDIATDKVKDSAVTQDKLGGKTPASPHSRFYPNAAAPPKLTKERTVSQAKAALKPRQPAKPTAQKHSHFLSNNNTSKPVGLEPLKSALKSTKKSTDSLPGHSELAESKIYGFTSAKLSYLLDRVIAHHQDEKILIFYQGNHIAYYIAQALDLVGIRYLIYAGSLPSLRKTAYITTFTTTETFRVLLMNVTEAAHGLHIACASRVFFVNPVWQPNVEAQAIKRAHRIGQTRPVYVETLVLSGTLEDEMLRRRNGMTTLEHQKAESGLLDDATMSRIIQNADFIPFSEDEIHDERKQVAMLQIPQQVFARTNRGEGDVDDPDADLIFPEDLHESNKEEKKRKRKVIHEGKRRKLREPSDAENIIVPALEGPATDVPSTTDRSPRVTFAPSVDGAEPPSLFG